MKRLFINGKIVDCEREYRAELLLDGEKIAAILPPGTEAEADIVTDVSGKYILPGVIDGHVHVHDPGQSYRMEDFAHGTQAAAAGGVTTIISHPLNDPVTTTVENYNVVVNAYKNRGYVDYALHGGAVGDKYGEARRLWEETGVVTLKMFLNDAGKDFQSVTPERLQRHLENMAEIGALAIIHAEDNELLQSAIDFEKSQGHNDAAAHLASHTRECEIKAVKNVISCLKRTGGRAMILHVGLCELLDLIAEARSEGVEIYAETCPHYLTFTEEDVIKQGAFMRFSPVVRDRANRERLWQMVNDGYVNTWASDHSPYARKDKEAAQNCIWNAPNGIPGLETLLPVLLNGVNEGKISLSRVVDITSKGPAEIYGLDYRKGKLRPGYDADITVVDMDEEFVFDEQNMRSPCKWSTYNGMKFKGRPVMTVVRGRTVYENGKIVGQAGYGQLLSRKK